MRGKKLRMLLRTVATASMLFAGQAFGQTADSASGVGKPGSVRNLVTDLYGGNGLTLGNGFHSGHFSADSLERLNNLANIIASNIGSFTFNSTVAGVTFDLDAGVPVRSQQSLGPLIAERATTIGAGRINLGVSYTNIVFKKLNGRNLSDLSIRLAHETEDEPVPLPAYTEDVVVLNLDLNLRQQVVAFIGTYGITDNLDVGFVAPLIHVSGQVRSVASIEVGEDNVGTPTANIHQFLATNPVDTNRANATGLGDVVVRAKWHAIDGMNGWLDAGVILQGTLATGDEDDLLGSGSNAVYVGGIASAELGKLNPHLNVGYEYFIDQNKPVGINVDRSNVRAVAGFDLKARDNFAFSSELLGRWENAGNKYYNFAVGAKWAPVGDVPISANIVVPINRDDGLRPNFYFTFGIESTF